MKLTPTLRLLVTAVVLAAGTALLWWLIGYTMGKGILAETGGLAPFRHAYGYEERALLQLLSFALVAPLAQAIVGSAPTQGRWIALGAAALGAGLVFGGKEIGPTLGFALFVAAAAAAAESSGVAQLVAALFGAVVVAVAFVLELPVGTGEKLIVIALRALFFFGPLLLGSAYVERYVLARLEGGRATVSRSPAPR